MKKHLLLFFITTMLAVSGIDSGAQPKNNKKVLRKIENHAFNPGEELKYRVHYGFIDAGEAVLEISKESKVINDREVYHMIGRGRSLGAFDWFFKVRDRYETFIDKEAFIPWKFIRDVNEGGYKIDETITFDHYNNLASTESVRNKKPKQTGTYESAENVQDMLSAFYYARTLDLSKAKPGDIFPIEAFIDNEVIPLNIKFVGREVVKNRKGSFNCLKFKPLLQVGRVFKEKEEMTVWISDDLNRIPIRLETAVIVGSIKMDLVDFKNLRHPLNLAKK